MKTLSTRAHAAKLIKGELRKAFKGVKFSVRSRVGTVHDAIDVAWVDGPDAREVDAIVDKYQEGHFDGMTDSYDYSNRRTDLPQVSFVLTHRRVS